MSDSIIIYSTITIILHSVQYTDISHVSAVRIHSTVVAKFERQQHQDTFPVNHIILFKHKGHKIEMDGTSKTSYSSKANFLTRNEFQFGAGLSNHNLQLQLIWHLARKDRDRNYNNLSSHALFLLQSVPSGLGQEGCHEDELENA